MTIDELVDVVFLPLMFAWDAFEVVVIPGIGLPLLYVLLGFFFLSIVLSLIGILLGVSFGGEDGPSVGYGSRSSRRVKVDSRRSRDDR